MGVVNVGVKVMLLPQTTDLRPGFGLHELAKLVCANLPKEQRGGGELRGTPAAILRARDQLLDTELKKKEAESRLSIAFTVPV